MKVTWLKVSAPRVVTPPPFVDEENPLTTDNRVSVSGAVALITCTALPPLRRSPGAAEPSMVMALVMDNVETRLMVLLAGRLNTMVSPGSATEMHSRSEPGPLSFVFVTVNVFAANAGRGARSHSSNQTVPTPTPNDRAKEASRVLMLTSIERRNYTVRSE